MRNTNNTTDGPQVFTFGGNEQLVFQFEALLKKQQGISGYPRNSNLERASYSVMEMLEAFKKGGHFHDNTRDCRPEWRQACALGDLLRKILSASKKPHFEQLWPHILLLLGDTNIAQNSNSPITDADANKLFELYTALVVSPIANDLEFDCPRQSSGGNNPDIIADIEGVRWGFACKVMHTPSAETLIGTVRKGVSQIDRAKTAKGKADRGVVVVSLKNVIPHDEFWPITREDGSGDIIYQCWRDLVRPEKKLHDICQRYHAEVIDRILGVDGFNAVFSETENVPCDPVVLLHLSTTIGLATNVGPTHTLLRSFGKLTAGDLSPEVQALIEKLNLSLHDQFVDFAATDVALTA